MNLVVDASVAVKWFIPEENSNHALKLLKDDWKLFAPDLIWPELGNILWKKFRRDELELEESKAIIRDLCRLPIQTRFTKAYIDKALDIAMTYQRSVYDSTYLALAIQLDSRFVTADSKLCNGLKNTEIEKYLLPVDAL